MKILIAILIVGAVIAILVLVRRQKPAAPEQESISNKSKDDTSRPLLKQFGNLKLSDFAEHPVWVNVHVIDYGKDWYDETDEETFRPWYGNLPADPSETMFLVRAKLTLADGSEYDGFITPQHESEESDLGAIQPYLFAKSGELISFWFGMFQPSKKDINGLYEQLSKNANQVFPIQFEAEGGIATGIVKGVIPGLCRRGKNNEVIVDK
jgi:hypothetical protein